MGCPSGSGLDGYLPQFCVILCSWASKRKESPAFFQSLKVSLRQVQKLTVLICLSTEVKGLEKESMPFYPLRTPLGLCLALFTTKNFSFLMFTEQKVFPCGSGGKESACNAADLGLIPGLGRSPGEGKGYALQYSGLERVFSSSRVLPCSFIWNAFLCCLILPDFLFLFLCIPLVGCFPAMEK